MTQVRTFARQAWDLGVRYLGLCCGNRAHYTRALVEEIGRTPAASRYSPDMSQHFRNMKDNKYKFMTASGPRWNSTWDKTVVDIVWLSRLMCLKNAVGIGHDDVIRCKHFPRYFLRGIHRSPVNSPHKASDAELWCFFDLRLNKRLSKQSWGWWSVAPSRSLWRHCNDRMGLLFCSHRTYNQMTYIQSADMVCLQTVPMVPCTTL